MNKTNTIMKLEYKGKTFSVVKHNDVSVNPYWLYMGYHTYRILDGYRIYKHHRKLLVKHANIASVLYYLVNTVDFNE